jgi:hypothetical protein
MEMTIAIKRHLQMYHNATRRVQNIVHAPHDKRTCILETIDTKHHHNHTQEAETKRS